MAYEILKPVYTPAGRSTWYDMDGLKHTAEQFSVSFVKIGSTHTGGARSAMESAKKHFREQFHGEPPVLRRVK